MISAIAAVGYDGTLAIDYRGEGDGTIGVLNGRAALEAAIQRVNEARKRLARIAEGLEAGGDADVAAACA